MIDAIVEATDDAIRAVALPRFLRSERGFQGRFYCDLQQELEKRGVLQHGHILEMEYQKSERHSMRQRPDIVLHLPAEETGGDVRENSVAVWALKRQATERQARSDFDKLDEMIRIPRYPIAIFINVDAKNHFAGSYGGRFPEHLRTVAVSMEDGEVIPRWGRVRE
jgi:hypothetical protein